MQYTHTAEILFPVICRILSRQFHYQPLQNQNHSYDKKYRKHHAQQICAHHEQNDHHKPQRDLPDSSLILIVVHILLHLLIPGSCYLLQAVFLTDLI